MMSIGEKGYRKYHHIPDEKALNSRCMEIIEKLNARIDLTLKELIWFDSEKEAKEYALGLHGVSAALRAPKEIGKKDFCVAKSGCDFELLMNFAGFEEIFTR